MMSLGPATSRRSCLFVVLLLCGVLGMSNSDTLYEVLTFRDILFRAPLNLHRLHGMFRAFNTRAIERLFTTGEISKSVTTPF